MVAELSTSIDIIIVNYCCAADTLAAVAALSPWQHGVIRVVDNSADAEEFARLHVHLADRHDVELLAAEHNLGFGKACNLAFAQSPAEFVFLLNPDARISESAILSLARIMASDSRWAGLSPRVFWDPKHRFLLPTAFPFTPLNRSLSIVGTHTTRWSRMVARWHLSRMRNLMDAPQPFRVAFQNGATLLLRRSAVLAVGGLFNPAYFMFFEDSDLSLRLRRAGYALGIAPSTEALHEYRHRPWKGPMMADSEQIYFRLNFPVFWRLSAGLTHLARYCADPDWVGSGCDLGLIDSAQALAKVMNNRGILALSPSPLMMPALFRPAHHPPVLLSNEDWERLEPGRYTVLSKHIDNTTPPQLVGNDSLTELTFERV